MNPLLNVQVNEARHARVADAAARGRRWHRAERPRAFRSLSFRRRDARAAVDFVPCCA